MKKFLRLVGFLLVGLFVSLFILGLFVDENSEEYKIAEHERDQAKEKEAKEKEAKEKEAKEKEAKEKEAKEEEAKEEEAKEKEAKEKEAKEEEAKEEEAKEKEAKEEYLAVVKSYADQSSIFFKDFNRLTLELGGGEITQEVKDLNFITQTSLKTARMLYLSQVIQIDVPEAYNNVDRDIKSYNTEVGELFERLDEAIENENINDVLLLYTELDPLIEKLNSITDELKKVNQM